MCTVKKERHVAIQIYWISYYWKKMETGSWNIYILYILIRDWQYQMIFVSRIGDATMTRWPLKCSGKRSSFQGEEWTLHLSCFTSLLSPHSSSDGWESDVVSIQSFRAPLRVSSPPSWRAADWAGSCATKSLASLAQQRANQLFWEQQWARPEPPLAIHEGSGTNGSQPSKAWSAQATAWRKPSLTKTYCPEGSKESRWGRSSPIKELAELWWAYAADPP